MAFTQFDLQGLMPAFAPELARTRVFSLPYGGPTGTGGKFSQGQLLGCVGVAAQSEVATLTIGGTPTGGTFTAGFTGYGVGVTAPLAYNVSLANFQAALVAAVPEWNGNVTVTGTPGASYVVTFNNLLANQRIGGLFTVGIGGLTGGTPTGAWARTTRGSCGLAQADVYSQGSNNFADALLQYDTYLTPGGAIVPAAGIVSANQPFQPSAYVAGWFNPADLVGVDANALTLGTLASNQGGLFYKLN